MIKTCAWCAKLYTVSPMNVPIDKVCSSECCEKLKSSWGNRFFPGEDE